MINVAQRRLLCLKKGGVNMKLSQIALSGLLLVSLQAIAMQEQGAGALDAPMHLQPIGGSGNTGDTAAQAEASKVAKLQELEASHALQGQEIAALKQAVGAGAAGAAAGQGRWARAKADAHRRWIAACGYAGGVLSLIAPHKWSAGVTAAATAATGATLFAFLDDSRVQGLLHKLGESSLEADIDVATLTTLISYGVYSGNTRAFSIAGWYALGRTIAKLVSSDIATIGLSKLPLIGDQLVSEQELKRAENGVVPLSEKGAQATKVGVGIAVFVLAQKYLPLVQGIKLGNPFRGKAKTN